MTIWVFDDKEEEIIELHDVEVLQGEDCMKMKSTDGDYYMPVRTFYNHISKISKKGLADKMVKLLSAYVKEKEKEMATINNLIKKIKTSK